MELIGRWQRMKSFRDSKEEQSESEIFIMVCQYLIQEIRIITIV